MWTQALQLKTLLDDPALHRTSLSYCLQDREGFIWLGTSQGLFRYDGTDLRAFPLEEQSPAVRSLYQAPDSTLWVGFENGQLAFLSPGSAKLISLPASFSQAISGFATDSRGRLWLATYGQGLFCLQADTLLNLSTRDGLADDYVYALQADRRGILWAGTDRGLARISFDRASPKLQRLNTQHGLPDNIVRSLSLDSEGYLWAGTESGGVCRINPETAQIERLGTNPWSWGSVQALLPQAGNLWVATANQGVLLLSKENPDSLISHLLPTQGVSCLLSDRQGKTWLGAGSEIYLADPLLRTWPLPGGISQLYALWPDDSLCWLASDQGLIRYSLRSKEAQTIFRTKNQEPISSLWLDAEGTMWCATLGDGLYRYTNSGRLERFTEADGLPNNNVLSVHGNSKGELWLSTLGGIAYRSSADKKFTKFEGQYPKTNFVYDVHLAHSGRVWFATDGEGVAFLQDGKSAGLAQELPSKNIYALREGAQYMLMLPSEGGLLRWQKDSLSRIDRSQGLRSLSLLAADINPEGWLLAVHAEGIDLAAPQLQRWKYMGAEDGFAAFDLYPNALRSDRKGTFWLGTPTQLMALQPPNEGLPPLETRLTEVQQLFETVELTKKEFGYQENHLSFRYTALQFPASDLIRYQHFLEGFDAGWHTTRNNLATYPNLPPGSYTFRVRAANNEQFTTAGPEASYQFRIQAPWWQESWFLILVLVLGSSAIVGIVRLREQQVRREAQRKQEATQLELQTLRSQINPHFLFNSFNTLITEIEQQGKAAAPYAEALSDFFRHILSYQDKNLIPLKEELTLAENYLYLQQKRYGSGLQIELDPQTAALPYLLPPLSLQQLLENALKHNMITPQKPLSLKIWVEEGFLCMRNNRQARRQASRSTGIGLENIRRRYQLLTAQEIRVEETTELFTVCLPLLSL